MKTCFFNSGVKFKNFKVLDNRNAKEKSIDRYVRRNDT